MKSMKRPYDKYKIITEDYYEVENMSFLNDFFDDSNMSENQNETEKDLDEPRKGEYRVLR